MRALALFALAASVAACGPSVPPPGGPGAGEGHHHGHDHADGKGPHEHPHDDAHHAGGHGDHHGEGEGHGDHHGKGEGHDHHGEGHGDHHGKGHGEGKHPKLTGALHDFHGVLAPAWHTEAGPKRVAAACDAAPKMRAELPKLSSDVPEKAKADEAGYKGVVTELGKELDAVDAACKVEGRAGVEAAFSKLHDHFHALMDRAR